MAAPVKPHVPINRLNGCGAIKGANETIIRLSYPVSDAPCKPADGPVVSNGGGLPLWGRTRPPPWKAYGAADW